MERGKGWEENKEYGGVQGFRLLPPSSTDHGYGSDHVAD